MKEIIRAVFNNKTRTLDKSGLAAAMLMFRNTPRSPTDLSPAQLVFGRSLTDSIPFSRQMLHPQNRYEIEKRRLKVRENQRHENDSSKSYPYSDRVSESDFKTQSRRSGPSLERSPVSARQTETTGLKMTIKHIVIDETNVSSNQST
jgi:hypothetical protein